MDYLHPVDLVVVVLFRNHHCNNFMPAVETITCGSTEVEELEMDVEDLAFRFGKEGLHIVVGRWK